ncbi:MAG: GNAT family N-acetyltransferase [candidate division WOR-3 bacterium]|nr:GNAT family N-acetyltransferase [candidate division WOR-3 bacterium]MCX7757478.1 GNAT family N-acetyltransferase [candidate division WOR-3 bacterium]MDW7987143.1 GNAT family protein [candidate division WOR-3 bacterium]
MLKGITYNDISDTQIKIYLRPLKISDAADLYQNIKSRRVKEYMLDLPNPYRYRDALSFIRRAQKELKKKTGYTLGIVHEDTESVIGVVSLTNIDKKNKNCELGYWLGEKYWNRGIMTQAVQKILQLAFEKLKLHRISAKSFAGNLGAIRVLEKNHFRLEGIMYEVIYRNRYWHNIFLYGILKSDYEKFFK